MVKSKMKAMLFTVSADLPARAELMNIKYYTGKFLCHLCNREGTPYGANNLHRAWPFDKKCCALTHQGQIRNAQLATQRRAAAFGVKGTSVSIKLKNKFDLVYGFAIDWMHNVPLGAVKYFTNLLIADVTKENYFTLDISFHQLIQDYSKYILLM